ncbi:MAG: hypothetical protein UHX91_05855, partial [Methanosphaera sp.]|nr:hypothetical protein [Methanosphaera sp.]
MMNNTKFIFSIFIIFFLLITLTSINAASENGTQETFSDVSTPLKSDLNTGNIEQTRTSTHVLNTSSFNDYVSDGKFNDKVSDGDTIDIQGKLDNPRYALNINKPVNIISSTKDAYIDLDTISYGTGGDYSNGIFQVTSGSSGTNITGITFHNTRVWVKDTNNVHIDNITVICEQKTGSGVGSFSVRGNSENISVTNSYFKTIHNGGHSNVVVAGATNCLFENNTVEAWGTEGNVGNTFYLTTYGGSTNTNITIRNNTIRSIMPSSGICWGLVLEGKGHIIENNYINASAAVVAQYADAEYGVVTDLDGIIFRNNYIAYGGPRLTFPGEAYNNTINGPVTLGNIKAYNNTLENVTINNTVLFENNTAKKITILGENNTLNNNEVYSTEDYAIIIDGKNNTLTNNKLLSNNSYGEDSISNSTEYVSINNSERLSRVFYITDENLDTYFDDVSSDIGMMGYAIKDNVFVDGDILVFNLTHNNDYMSYVFTDYGMYGQSNYVDLVIENTTGTILPMFSKKLTFKNSFISSFIMVNGAESSLELINSTIGKQTGFGDRFSMDDSSILMSEYKYFLQNYPMLITSGGSTIPVLDNVGHILDSVEINSKILVCQFDKESDGTFRMIGASSLSTYVDNIYVN